MSMHDNCRELGMSTDPRLASSERSEPRATRYLRAHGQSAAWKRYRRHVLMGAFGNLKDDAYMLTKMAK